MLSRNDDFLCLNLLCCISYIRLFSYKAIKQDLISVFSFSFLISNIFIRYFYQKITPHSQKTNKLVGTFISRKSFYNFSLSMQNKSKFPKQSQLSNFFTYQNMAKHITKKVLTLCRRHLRFWKHFTFCAISKLPEAHPACVFLVLIISVLKQNHLSTRYLLVSIHRRSIFEQLILFSPLELKFSVLGLVDHRRLGQ